MQSVRSLYAVSQAETKAMDTTALRQNFHFDDVFASGEVRLLYTHYDRMLVGGVQPDGGVLVVDHISECGTPSFLDRREVGILNVGQTADVTGGGETYSLNRGDVLYLGMGSGPVTFGQGGRFYVVSTPAHRSLPAKLVKIEDAGHVKMGAPETANDRTIFQFIHPDVMESCQLVMGYTMFHGGSVWNTMPAHLHDRRMRLISTSI